MIPSRNLQKTLVLAHVLSSVGLFGAVSAFFALALAGLASAEPFPARAAYWAGGFVTTLLIWPLGVTALMSGIAVALTSPWGLLRHYWVVLKLALTILILSALLLHTLPILHMAQQATDLNFNLETLVAARRQLVIASGAGMVALFGTAVLSVFKPRGLTRYGWNRQHSVGDRPEP